MMRKVALVAAVLVSVPLLTAAVRPAGRVGHIDESEDAMLNPAEELAQLPSGIQPPGSVVARGLTTSLNLPLPTSAKAPMEVEGPEEYPDDPPVPAKVLERRPRRPARDWVVDRFTSIQVNVDQFGNNIVDDAANEPSIAIDPTNPNRMVVGWRQFDSILSNFRQAGVGYSHDAGQTWTFTGVLDPGQFRSDPVLAADPFGNFYYSSLSTLASVEVFKSTDGGVTWGPPIPAFGGDKQWMTVDPTAGIGSGNLYQVWNVQFTCCPPNDFTWSNDGGTTFASPIALPLPSMKWGALAVGPDGELYSAGSTLGENGHLLTKSTNARDPAQIPVWDFIVNIDLGGVTSNDEAPNPGGIAGTVWVDVDHSDGPTRGNVYVLGSVVPPGADQMNVNFIRSTDGGLTWSDPIVVSDGPFGDVWEWFGTMAVAPNGRIDVTWNDTRDDPTPDVPNESVLYYSYSLDAGETWSTGEPVTPLFDSHVGWPQQNKMGDYNHMVSDNGGSSLAYAATMNGEEDVFFVRLTPDCNGNGIADEVDIAGSTSDDCNGNLTPDECEAQDDCQPNGVQDICDIVGSTSEDCNHNNIPDECEPDEDCNINTVQDICDIAAGTSEDCNDDEIPDECQLTDNDCNLNTVPDECDIAYETSGDCNVNDIPDECDIAASTSDDCQPDVVPDECQTSSIIMLPQHTVCSPAADNGDAWCENFESYPLGIVGSIDGLNGWSGWAGNPNAVGPVVMDVNHTLGGAKSLMIGTRDTVRVFTGYDLAASRGWVITAWIYVPGVMQGNADFIVMCDYGGGAGNIWAIELMMNTVTGYFTNIHTGEHVPLITDRWAEIRLEVDLQEDSVAVYYDQEFIGTEPWANPGGSMAIAAIDLYGPNTTPFYYDDLSIYPANIVTSDCNLNTIPDECDIADLTSDDCNGNVVPDACEPNEDCNSNGTQDICDVAEPTILDCNGNRVPDDCETNEDCNGNTVQDICDVAAGTSNDCNGNSIPDECELTGNDCNTNSVPDECDIMEAGSPDCNGNAVPDECDIAASTSDDCQPDGVPDDCQLDGLAVIVEPEACGPTADNGEPWCDDFESYSLGLIHGANSWEGFLGDPDQAGDVSNAQNHTLSGTQSLENSLLDTTTRVLNGYDGSVSNAWEFRGWLNVSSSTEGLAAIILWADYDSATQAAVPSVISVVDPVAGLFVNWITGATMPAVTDEWAEIRILVDFDRDLAATYYNGVLLDLQTWTINGGSLSIAAVAAAGGGGDYVFYADDFSLYPAMASFTTDCNGNDIPDDCDLATLTSPDDNGNNIPDECECPIAAAAQPELLDIEFNPVSSKIRYLSFHAGDTGRSEAIRVTFTDLPAPYENWNGTRLWVQQPELYCENSGISQTPDCPTTVGDLPSTTFWGATLDCDPYWNDWTQYDLVHVWDEGIIPGGTYEIQVVDSTCLLAVEESYSSALILEQSRWADLIQDCSTTPCKPPDGETGIVDVTAILDKWKNLSGNVKKVRADIEGSPAGDHRLPDQAINITDVTYCLGAFLGETYPPLGFPPPSLPPSCDP